ncbi:MAG: hypothetical protein K2L82_07580 [Lachnospiraceae bacterium]|nr:hypothetical protein [Lachnospiraceae bacterium]
MVWVYAIQAAVESMVLVGMVTAQYHTLFYFSMKILTDGMQNPESVGA